MEQQQREDLHARIMNLPCKYEAAWQTPAPSDWIEGYVNGHRDTRHAAAELAAEHASELRSLRMTSPTTAAMDLARSALREQAERIRVLEEALSGLLNTWNATCDLWGWDRDHMVAAEVARAALNKEKP